MPYNNVANSISYSNIFVDNELLKGDLILAKTQRTFLSVTIEKFAN